MNENKKAISLLKKYYLPHSSDGNPSDAEKESAIAVGVFVLDSVMTHDEIVSEIKALSEQISIADTAKAFLYSLSSGDTRYRTAISSLIWAKALPVHACLPEQSKTGECTICGCCHGLKQPELIDWNRYGVFRYLPPIQYGNSPDYGCAEYVLNDLREFKEILWETYPIVCHKELETSDIDFGFDIVNDRIVWGLTVHKMEDDSPDFIAQVQKWIRNKPEDVPWFSFNCSVGINICSGELTPGQISTDKTDDYYNIPKQMVIVKYGLNKVCPADDFAKRFGGITSEQYIEFLEKRI